MTDNMYRSLIAGCLLLLFAFAEVVASNTPAHHNDIGPPDLSLVNAAMPPGWELLDLTPDQITQLINVEKQYQASVRRLTGQYTDAPATLAHELEKLEVNTLEHMDDYLTLDQIRTLYLLRTRSMPLPD